MTCETVTGVTWVTCWGFIGMRPGMSEVGDTVVSGLATSDF